MGGPAHRDATARYNELLDHHIDCRVGYPQALAGFPALVDMLPMQQLGNRDLVFFREGPAGQFHTHRTCFQDDILRRLIACGRMGWGVPVL